LASAHAAPGAHEFAGQQNSSALLAFNLVAGIFIGVAPRATGAATNSVHATVALAPAARAGKLIDGPVSRGSQSIIDNKRGNFLVISRTAVAVEGNVAPYPAASRRMFNFLSGRASLRRALYHARLVVGNAHQGSRRAGPIFHLHCAASFAARRRRRLRAPPSPAGGMP